MKQKFGNVVLASDLRRAGSNERLVANNGELNASNKNDLMVAIAQLIDVAGKHTVLTDSKASEVSNVASTHREMVMAAFDSKEELAALGDLMADNLTITSNRDGFMRRVLRQQNIENGQIPSVRMSMKQVSAAIGTGPVQSQTQFIRDNEIFPQEFYITARPYIEQRQISRSNTDILEEKYVEALEAIMVQEDRTWKQMADSLIGLDNPHLNISGSFTPQAFAELTTNINNWGIVPAVALVASDLWQDIVANSDWSSIIDPVSQHELLLTGKLGQIHGVELITDQFRHPQHKVLNSGEIYVVGGMDYHGQYTDRGGVTSQPIDGTQERVPGRGWFLSELMSMVIGNSRSVTRGRRI